MKALRRMAEMVELYGNWPTAIADRLHLLPRGRLVTLQIRRYGMGNRELELVGETGAEDVRRINSMWLEDMYFSLLPSPSPLRSAPVIVDVGANRGYFSARVLAQFPEAHLYCFEPEPRNATLLRRNLANAGARALIQEVALTATAQEDVTLFLAPLPGEHTLIRERASQRTKTNPETTISVRSATIADALSNILREESEIDLLKIDTEGSEADLITAIPDEILSCIRAIVAEVENKGSAPRSQLGNLGFRLQQRGPILAAWKAVD